MPAIDSLISSLGGTAEVAGALGFKLPRVSNWALRGRIPATSWPAVAELARARKVEGVSVEALAAMHAEARP